MVAVNLGAKARQRLASDAAAADVRVGRRRSEWPPECPRRCGFKGVASAESSPYIDCGGDPAKHVREPVDPIFVVATAPTLSPPAVPKVTDPRRQQQHAPTRGLGTPQWEPTPPPSPGRPERGETGCCGTCNRVLHLMPGAGEPVLREHTFRGGRCGGSGWPARATAAS